MSIPTAIRRLVALIPTYADAPLLTQLADELDKHPTEGEYRSNVLWKAHETLRLISTTVTRQARCTRRADILRAYSDAMTLVVRAVVEDLKKDCEDA